MPTLADNPRQQATEKPRKAWPVVLRCFLWSPAKEVYYAECVDLDIMVRANSPQRAFEELQSAMLGYLHVVLEGKDGDGTTGLIPRPSPLSHRLRYRCYCLLAAISLSRHTLRLFDWSPPKGCTSYC